MRLATLLLLSCLLSSLTAQKFIPLQFHEAVLAEYAGDLADFSQEKMVCSDQEFPNREVVIVGQPFNKRILLDTVGLNATGTGGYVCYGCDQTDFGTATIQGDTLIYDPNTDVSVGLDTVSVAFCEAGVCSDTTQLIFLIRRAGRTLPVQTIAVNPEQRLDVIVPAEELPGQVVCRELVECATPDNYPGRSQQALFIFGLDGGNDFQYQASRFGGTDRLCLRVCDEFGVCDTYPFAFTIQQPARQLPFFDDFSGQGFVTDPAKWLNREVLVNTTYGDEPPSVGVATFDGIDSRGLPYAVSANNQSIPADFLTSVPLDLNGRPGTVLTFYAQPRGFGSRPETGDSLVLQFLQPNGIWNTVWKKEGLPSGESNASVRPFIGYRVPVADGFLHNAFQFRFFNVTDEAGALDTWNLDYVRLDDQETELIFNDVAFTKIAPYATAPYTSLPYRQFQAGGESLINQNLLFGLWNHGPQPEAIENSGYTVTNLETGENLINVVLLNGQQANIVNGMPVEIPIDLAADAPFNSFFGNYSNLLLNQPTAGNEDRVDIRTSLFIGESSQETTPGLVECVQRNDAVRTTTVFDNYYAYDDGTAEVALQALPGQSIVQKYVAYEADVLRGVRLSFPRTTTNFSSSQISIVIYTGALEGQPDYQFTVNPIFPATFFTDSLQGFATYPLPDSFPLPTGDFYVGWRQLGTAGPRASVGYDRNNVPENVIFFNNGGNWIPLTGTTTGALMIRPVVGSVTPGSTAVEDDFTDFGAGWQLFPNPATDRVRIADPAARFTDFRFELFDLTGRRLPRHVSPGGELDLSGLPAGLYLVRGTETTSGRSWTRKLVVR